MTGVGVSGQVRVVHGVPVRLKQNRDDTSWAEEYRVSAGRPLDHLGKKPHRFPGPWRVIGRLIVTPHDPARWQVAYTERLHVPSPAMCDCIRSFNDGLGELADQWRAHLAFSAGGTDGG